MIYSDKKRKEKGITLLRMFGNYTWNEATEEYSFTKECFVTKDLERIFEKISGREREYCIDMIYGFFGLDLKELAKAYRCVFFDLDDERRWKGSILDGLELSIEYVLQNNDLLRARVDEGKMLTHLSRIGLESKERDDRVVYLSRYIESYAADNCDYLLEMITEILSRDGSIRRIHPDQGNDRQ